MKLTRRDFHPITIIIETQDELDQLYGVCRSTKFAEKFPLFNDIYNVFINDDFQIKTKDYYDKFVDMLKNEN